MAGKTFNRDVRISGGGALYVNEVKVIDASGNIDAPVTTTNLTTSGNTTLGDAAGDTTTITGACTHSSTTALNDTTTVATTKKILFRDSAISISSVNDGYMDIAADTAVRIAAATNITGASTVTGTFGVTGTTTVTSANAASLAVGRLGATTPAFTVDSSTGSQVAGLKITGAATGGTVAVVATDSGADTYLTVNAKGAGTIGIASASTGVVTITPATTITGLVTLTAGTTDKVIHTGTETIAAGGTSTALDLTKFHHDIDADVGGDIFTLADGTAGQITTIVLKTATGVATITPATFLGGTSVTLNAIGDSVLLLYTALGRQIIGGNSYAIV